VSTRTPDAIDDHYYNDDPAYFAGLVNRYDTASRTGPKVIVGEYAATQGQATGTLAAALGEAAFMTGLERNADLVIGASYAPLLVNENAPNWKTNLIGYDAATSYGAPSYHVQQMFGANLGDHVTPTQLAGGNGSLYVVASRSAGRLYLTVVNRGGGCELTVNLSGLTGTVTGATATVLRGDPAAVNSLSDPEAVSPHTLHIGIRAPSFHYTFPANSVTVLGLTTG
jgi:alpha-L-arabinofuranosidase